MSQKSEFEQFLERLSKRDDEAAVAVVRALYERVIGLVRPRIGPLYAAKISPESVSNSAFQSFFRRHAQSPYQLRDMEDVLRLVARIALHKCFNRLRRFRGLGRNVNRERSSEDIELVASTQAPEFDTEVRDLLEVHTRSMKEVERSVIHLSLLGTPVREIAEATRLSSRQVIRIRVRFAKNLSAADCREEEPDEQWLSHSRSP